MIKVMSIFGTRPEAIKMAPLIKELNKRKEIKSIVCVTAQHREMLDQVLNIFNIEPDYDLNIMRKEQTLSDITANVLYEMEKVIKETKPDIILVHGDTTTTFSGALAAFYNHVAIGHVEAGLRTNDKYSPYPEEMNRQIVDRLTDMYFAPTELSKDNLLKENINNKKIYVTGNKAMRKIVEEFPDVKVIYPIHLNPKVRKIAHEVLDNCERIKIIEPLEVFDFHNYINKCYMILSDSGGVQEEAPSLGKPVLVLRNTTERPEGVQAGTLKLVGTSENNIYKEAKVLLNDKKAYDKMSKASNPYGDGHASERIVDAIVKKYCNKNI